MFEKNLDTILPPPRRHCEKSYVTNVDGFNQQQWVFNNKDNDFHDPTLLTSFVLF